MHRIESLNKRHSLVGYSFNHGQAPSADYRKTVFSHLDGTTLKIYEFCSDKESGYFLTKKECSQLRCLGEVVNGKIPFKTKGSNSLYSLGNNDYYMTASTFEEQSLLQGKIGHPTGYVTSFLKLHFSQMDYFDLSQLSLECFKANVRPWFVVKLTLTESKRTISFSCPKDIPQNIKPLKEALYEKYSKAQGFNRDDEIILTYKVRAVKGTDFTLPKPFIEALNLKPETSFIPHYNEDGSITFEAPIELCSCCGQPLDQFGGDTKRGYFCEHCSDTIPKVQDYIREKLGVTENALIKAIELLENDIVEKEKQLKKINELIRVMEEN